ncbi:hypothetical protein GGF42_000334 [Coemansia sp. RSA 2424]|nr:hypothetical protein GGF42_000334 [Coemansia sp. RSA 2424]
MFHFLVNMRCLKAVDFLSEVGPALRNLQFILRVLLKGLCLTLDSERMAKVLADRPIALGAMDLIADKCSTMEDGEVRAYAFRQTVADSTPLHRQMLHYIILAISRLDIRGSQSTYAFYQDLLAMLLDLAVPQPSRSMLEPGGASVFVCELVETVGPANTFNVECSQADTLIRSLLMNAVDAPPAPSAQGLVLSAYSYLFSRQSTSTQSKVVEQYSLLLLLLLISQPVDETKCNPYLHALVSIKDASEVAASKLDSYGALASVPFPKLFTKLVAETLSTEWTVLFQVLVSRNEAFRTYVLSRTDTDTLVMPLLQRVNMATALPIPSSAAQTQHAAHAVSAQHGHKRNSGGGSGGISGSRRPGDKFVSSGLGIAKPAEYGAPTHVTTALGVGGGEILAYPRNVSATRSPTSTKHSAGAVSTTTTASSTLAVGSSPGSKVRQAALLPYAITPDNIPYVHLYLWLDILLSLSSDAQFVEQLGRTAVEFWPSLPQAMHKQPQSHCIVVEAMRVFQLNIMLLKDNQIHKLSMGILVNILNQTTNVTTAIAQKLVKLFEMIYKRYSKLDSLPGGCDPEELGVYTEVLTVLLTLFCRLINTNNPQFIYCLLQARDILGAFREDHVVSPRPESLATDRRRAVAVAAEVRVRVAYFHARIAVLPSGSQAKDILQLIESVVAGEEEGGRSQTRVDFANWPRHDHRWSEFMLPMAWELILSSSIATVDDVNANSILKEFERLTL